MCGVAVGVHRVRVLAQSRSRSSQEDSDSGPGPPVCFIWPFMYFVAFHLTSVQFILQLKLCTRLCTLLLEELKISLKSIPGTYCKTMNKQFLCYYLTHLMLLFLIIKLRDINRAQNDKMNKNHVLKPQYIT